MSRCLWTATPVVVSCTTFLTYVLMKGELDPARAFTAFTLLSVLRFPLVALPMWINNVVEALVSLRRIAEYVFSFKFQPTM